MFRHVVWMLLIVSGCLFVFPVVFPASALAQQNPSSEPQRVAVQTILAPEAASRLVEVDTLLELRTRPVPGGRFDDEAGVLRAAYKLDVDVAARQPAQAARDILPQVAASFGWAATAMDLEQVDVRTGSASSHVTYQQTFRGVPVFQRQVKVNLDQDGQPTMILSAYAPHLKEIVDFDVQPGLAASTAATRAVRLVAAGEGTASEPELVVVPLETPRLAWHLYVWPETLPVEWSVLLDAKTGDVIRVMQMQTHKQSHYVPSKAVAEVATSAATPLRRVDGRGLVFDPDPLTSADASYGAPYVDENDADLGVLNDQRVLVDLLDITQGTDGLYRLEGPYVRIVDGNQFGTRVYNPPTAESPDGFQYRRSEDEFEAVMAYYHIDKAQRYIQRLGFDDVVNYSFPVNPQTPITDDSFYYPAQRIITYGTGGVDDAEDAGVIWHEYGHAVLDDVARNLRGTTEGQAFHEGFADYFAASYARAVAEADVSKRSDWQTLFKWDSGDGTIWGGRVLDHSGTYPDDLPCVTRQGPCSIHNDGRLWATTMMQVYDRLGRDITDQLNLQSHRYLLAPVTFQDAAEAIVQADSDLFGGINSSLLIDIFGQRGLVDPAAFGPVAAHEPLATTEQEGGTRTLNVTAFAVSAAVRDVTVYYGTGSALTNTLALTASGDQTYVGELPVPQGVGTLQYYVEAVDEVGRSTFLPAGAPNESYAFGYGPDTVPPLVTHTPLVNVPLALWPVDVAAEVVDDLGVASVEVDYEVEGLDGTVVETGTFTLEATGDLYRAAFPVDVGTLQRDSQVHYSIRATDSAQSANVRRLPEQGTFTLRILLEGTLRSYSFEADGADLSATGDWARGTPTYGLETARSGENVWATAPNTAYTSQSGGLNTYLELPSLNLTGLDEVFLVFWHWYDAEHNGTASPDRTDAELWDGGNVKYSVDGGVTWQLAQPEGGYSGTIIDSSNPLSRQPAFGGYSFGWRRALVQLPGAADLRVRFEFGVDESNTEASRFDYAGWYLDDVTITTIRPTDTTPPNILEVTPGSQIQAVGAAASEVVLTGVDNTGIADVWMEYAITDRNGMGASQTVRLEMQPDDVQRFRAAVPAWQNLAPGDRVAYQFRVRDVAGNERTVPDGGGSFLLDYRLVESQNALTSLSASGVWARTGGRWQALASGDSSLTRSSLVFAPFDLPTNATDLVFMLEHSYNLRSELGGNVKLSTDGGTTWEVLVPAGGYNRMYQASGPHPMEGENVFGGTAVSPRQAVFDMSAYGGQQVRLRLDLATPRGLQGGEFWQVQQATLSRSSTEDAFDVPRTTALHANFPDPFAGQTTISFTLEEAMPVTLDVYDVLGRRVATLADGRYDAGTHTLSFTPSSLSNGVYFLRAQMAGQQHIERMIISR